MIMHMQKLIGKGRWEHAWEYTEKATRSAVDRRDAHADNGVIGESSH